MLQELKLRLARRREIKRIATVLADAGEELDLAELRQLVRERKVVVLKKRKSLRGAFIYGTLGVAGLLSILFIRKLAIQQQSRGQGLGSALLMKLKVFTAQKKAAGFLLFALAAAQGFYAKHRLSNFWRFFWWWR